MPVYLVQFGDDGPVKIGHGKNPRRRLLNLQAGCPVHLRLLGTRPGGEAEERELHKRFQSSRIRGEWFAFVPEMLVGLDTVESRRTPSRLGRPFAAPPNALSNWMDANGVSNTELAAKIGVAQSTISRIRCGRRTASSALVMAIVCATDGAVTADELLGLDDEAADVVIRAAE
jgi:Meiotically up-regulated gene 113/Putative antitoxin of bacterial toxin-antitoxin system, YdaS/YdaT